MRRAASFVVMSFAVSVAWAVPFPVLPPFPDIAGPELWIDGPESRLLAGILAGSLLPGVRTSLLGGTRPLLGPCRRGARTPGAGTLRDLPIRPV